MAQVEAIYWGAREDMIAEVSAWDPMEMAESGHDIKASQCRYLVMPVGDAQFNTEYFSTKKDAMACAKENAKFFGCKVASV